MTPADRLRRGDRLYMGLGPQGRVWWFEAPYEIVPESAIRDLGNVEIAEAGDCLFGWRDNSQTWLPINDDAL